MNLIGNIIWVIFGGILLSLGYLFGGLVLCLNCRYSFWSADYETWFVCIVAIWRRGSAIKDTDGLLIHLTQCSMDYLWRNRGCPRSPHDGCNILYHNHWNPIWFAALQTYDARSYAIWQYDCL